MQTWGGFAAAEPELAAYGAGRLAAAVAYLATVRENGAPRVHPVTPVVARDGLYVFMEPASPKGRDLRERGWYALHNGVPDTSGSGGEFAVSGKGIEVDDAASYDPADRYVLFELLVAEARCTGYGDVPLPERHRWPDPGSGHG